MVTAGRIHPMSVVQRRVTGLYARVPAFAAGRLREAGRRRAVRGYSVGRNPSIDR